MVGGLTSCAPSYKSGCLTDLVGSLNPASRSEVVFMAVVVVAVEVVCAGSFMCVDRNVRFGGATTLCLTDRRYLNGLRDTTGQVLLPSNDYIVDSER